MLTVTEKIKHLQKLGLNGDMSEIEKMYSGKEFNVHDLEYQKLVALSQKYCLRFTELSSLIATSKTKEEIDKYTKEKSEILDILFPNHGLIFGGGDGLCAVIGMVDLDGYNYINARVHFNASSLVHLEEYVFVASNVEFGTNSILTNEKKTKIGTINVDKDTWIGANVTLEDHTHIGARSVIGMGSHIVTGTDLKSDMISFGNPCKEYKTITEDYETKIKIPDISGRRTDEEIKKILAHMKKIGINGDFNQYIRALNYEKYNTLEPTIAQIYDLSHRLCSEYNSQNISVRRRKEILDMLFPLQGKNLIMGDDIFVDCIGTVKIGDDVTIGDHPTLAGNITIGDNVKIGNNVALQTTGHEINYKGRKLSCNEQGALCEISTPGYIIILPSIVLADGTKVIPDKTVSYDTNVDEIVSHNR